jgi:hypothetical protein
MSPLTAAADAGGRLLSAATATLAALRPAAKPLHPEGEVRAGRLERHGRGPRSGVPWLDEPGEDPVEVRLSRAIGLPDALPDIHGLALRVHGTDGPGDVLLASTGTGRVTRHVLTASRDPRGRPLTTLLPYATDGGPVVLAADSLGPDEYRLSWSHPARPWHEFGTLYLDERRDARISFDPVLNRVPGLQQYPWVTRLREPAYRRARRSRTRPT